MSDRPYVLLDRDGTLIVERVYLSDPEGVELLPGAAAGLKRMAALGLGLIVISNQAGVGKGLFSLARLEEIHRRMGELLAAEGIVLDGIYFCPHTADAGCACRKPKIGLVLQAAREHGFDPRRCFMVGDKAIDVECGRNAGAAAVLVRTGYGAEVEREGRCRPDAVVADLLEAAEFVERKVSSLRPAVRSR